MTRKTSTSSSRSSSKQARKLRLADEDEEIIKQEEQVEFRKVLEQQVNNIDPEQLKPLPECSGAFDIQDSNQHPMERLMMIMLQYQSFRSYTQYSEDEVVQEEQIKLQKASRFELMKKKRAIRREKRKVFKMKKRGIDQVIDSADGAHSKRIKYDDNYSLDDVDGQLYEYYQDEEEASNDEYFQLGDSLSNSSSSEEDLGDLDIESMLLPSPMPVTSSAQSVHFNNFPSSFTKEKAPEPTIMENVKQVPPTPAIIITTAPQQPRAIIPAQWTQQQVVPQQQPVYYQMPQQQIHYRPIYQQQQQQQQHFSYNPSIVMDHRLAAARTAQQQQGNVITFVNY